jgi:O-antigen/teichoic acid export membrane protein
MLHFSSFHTLSTIGNQAIQNADYILVARYLGQEALGYYSLAFQLAAVPIQRLAGLVGYVAFPIFSRVVDQNERLRTSYQVLLKGCALVACAFSLSGICAAPLLVFVCGDKWTAAESPLQIIALGAILYAVREVSDSVYLAKGRTDLRFLLTSMETVAFCLLVLLYGLNFGVIGVASSLIASLAISGIVSLLFASQILGVSPTTVARELLGPLLGLSLSGGLAYAFGYPYAATSPRLPLNWLPGALLGSLTYAIWTARDLRLLYWTFTQPPQPQQRLVS